MDHKAEKVILDAVREAAKDGRLSCTMARKLAEELKVTPASIGKACHQLQIKIKACELGCF
ncbi:hypothetical protein DCCM_3659 [Desulfocucumis palustris]|uniref:Uncharacterized protein n=1 Tax=Desulfocucumis palustris TaxID=1898651 RepID=A0A2L2XEF2_9FIRM|nr:hypothetical protein [Desulfocucumis palustris]GBF34540.1 hypothetical protein DCCM_3659 [Desulfocucumis palustris]